MTKIHQKTIDRISESVKNTWEVIDKRMGFLIKHLSDPLSLPKGYLEATENGLLPELWNAYYEKSKEEIADLFARVFLIAEFSKLDSSKSIDNQLVAQTAFLYFDNTLRSLVVYGKSLNQLLIEAKNGNDDALFKALIIDKSILELSWTISRIRKAYLGNDLKFLKKLGKSLGKEIGVIRKQHLGLVILLHLYWTNKGLKNLPVSKIFEILENNGIHGRALGVTSELTLHKFLNRLGLKKGANKTPSLVLFSEMMWLTIESIGKQTLLLVLILNYLDMNPTK